MRHGAASLEAGCGGGRFKVAKSEASRAPNFRGSRLHGALGSLLLDPCCCLLLRITGSSLAAWLGAASYCRILRSCFALPLSAPVAQPFAFFWRLPDQMPGLVAEASRGLDATVVNINQQEPGF